MIGTGSGAARWRRSLRRPLVAVLLAALAAGLLAGCRFAGTTDAGGPGPRTSPAALDRIPAAPARRTAPVVNRCAHNRAAQRVIVSIRHQHLWLCRRHRTAYDTPVTTGRDTPSTRTPTGRFRVQARTSHAVLRPDTGGSYRVRYWVPFDAPDYGFHDARWQHFPYGSARYRTAGSHGCVHLPLAAMRHLYRWVHVGAAVTIR
jgi:lipoprotein-anchoring transpeptidase ErfK/SrfK